MVLEARRQVLPLAQRAFGWFMQRAGGMPPSVGLQDRSHTGLHDGGSLNEKLEQTCALPHEAPRNASVSEQRSPGPAMGFFCGTQMPAPLSESESWPSAEAGTQLVGVLPMGAQVDVIGLKTLQSFMQTPSTAL